MKHLYTKNNIKLRGLWFLLILSNYLFAQTPVVSGTWKLQKHITYYQEEKFDCAKLFGPILLNLKENGTYEVVIHNLEDSLYTTITGSWKMSDDNKKLQFFNSDYKPHIPRKTVPDKTYSIIKLNAKEISLKENLCTPDIEGTSYYVRPK